MLQARDLDTFAADSAEYAFAGRLIEPGVLAKTPTVWECFRLVSA
jgi:hypothetical protein